MTKGIFIIGTDTGVGKTVVSAGIVSLLRINNYNACYFKPIASGTIMIGDVTYSIDSTFVKQVSQLSEVDDVIVPYVFNTPVSPHLASKLENNPIKIEYIEEKLSLLKAKYDYIIAEGCGGLCVPLSYDGLMLYHLILRLAFDVILVTRAGIGTINHTLLTMSFAREIGLNIRGIIVNGHTGLQLEDDNISMISSLTGVDIIGVIPKIHGVDTDSNNAGNLIERFSNSMQILDILSVMKDIPK